MRQGKVKGSGLGWVGGGGETMAGEGSGLGWEDGWAGWGGTKTEEGKRVRLGSWLGWVVG